MNQTVNSRRKRGVETPKKRILECALGEFSDHGFAGARMDRIATRAKISKRMLFYYFRSKANLFEIVLQDSIQLGRVDEPPSNDAFETAPFWSLFHLNNPQYARLLGWEGLEFRKANLPRLRKRREALDARLKKLHALFANWNWGKNFDPSFAMFGLIAVQLAPILLPNLAYTLLGEDVNSRSFRKKWVLLVRTFSATLTANRTLKTDA